MGPGCSCTRVEIMLLAGVFNCATVALASHQYTVAIEHLGGQQRVLGSINIALFNAYPLADFSPNYDAFPPPNSGCIGLLGNHGFVCQTEYKNIPSSHGAIRAFVGPDGRVVQVQLAEGSPGQLLIEVPNVVPTPEIQQAKARPKTAAGNQESLRSKWKDAKGAPAEDLGETDESGMSFLEKYWVYFVPVALLLVPTLFGPANR